MDDLFLPHQKKRSLDILINIQRVVLSYCTSLRQGSLNLVAGIWVSSGSTCHLKGPGKAVKISSHCARDNDHLWVGWAMFQKLWSLDFFYLQRNIPTKGIDTAGPTSDSCKQDWNWYSMLDLQGVTLIHTTIDKIRTEQHVTFTVQSLINIVIMRFCYVLLLRRRMQLIALNVVQVMWQTKAQPGFRSSWPLFSNFGAEVMQEVLLKSSLYCTPRTSGFEVLLHSLYHFCSYTLWRLFKHKYSRVWPGSATALPRSPRLGRGPLSVSIGEHTWKLHGKHFGIFKSPRSGLSWMLWMLLLQNLVAVTHRRCIEPSQEAPEWMCLWRLPNA